MEIVCELDLSIQEYYTPTCRLRYIDREIPISNFIAKKERILQQLWQGSKGTQEWKSIEIVKE